MDLSAYYNKLRDIERMIDEDSPVIVSYESSDGGKAGVRTEAPKNLAAKYLLTGKARLATPEEAKEYRDGVNEARRVAQEREASSRIQVKLISQADLDALRIPTQPAKG